METFQLLQHLLKSSTDLESKPIGIKCVMELSLVVRFSTILSVLMVQINSSDPAVTSHVTDSAIGHVVCCKSEENIELEQKMGHTD